MALGSDVVPRERGDRGRRRRRRGVSNSASKEGAVLRREKGNRPKTRPPSPLSFVFIRFAASSSSSSVSNAAAMSDRYWIMSRTTRTWKPRRKGGERAESSRRFQRVHCFRFLKRLRQTLAAWRARIADGISPRTTFKKSGLARLVLPWPPSHRRR